MKKERLLNLIAPIAKYAIPFRLPRVIAIEATNRCFINCVTCPIPQQMKRKKGDMTIETFTSFLRQIDWKIDRLSWAFGGEPLLNKDIWQMIKLASAKGAFSKVDTNAMLLERYIDDVFSSNLRILNIAFEGLSKESTSNFRQGYDYELVKENIQLISKRKHEIGAKYPLIALNYLVRKDNEHEIERTIELARQWRLDYITLKSINIAPSFWLSESNMQRLGDKFLPVNRTEFSRYIRKDGKWVPKEDLSNFCRYLPSSVTITWDGEVLPCCFDFDASMVAGNVRLENLKSIWRNDKFRRIREEVYNKSVSLCNNCTSVSLQEKIILNPSYGISKK